MSTPDSLKKIERSVTRRIRRDWRRDIEIIEVTVTERREQKRLGKTTRVEIGCSSYIACEQARISLAPFVANDASDWDADRWRVVEGDAHPGLPFRLELIEPQPDNYAAFEYLGP
jgi:hypothetical protein